MIEYWIDIPNLKTVNLSGSFQNVQSKSITGIYMNNIKWIDVSTILIDVVINCEDIKQEQLYGALDWIETGYDSMTEVIDKINHSGWDSMSSSERNSTCNEKEYRVI